MIIAIDASRAVREQPTGTELYSARLIQHLAKIDTDNTYFLYTPTAPTGELAKLPDNFVWRVIPFARLWTHLRLPVALLVDRPDLLFVPAHVVPLLNPVKKTVITIHDIASEVFPDMYSWFQRWYFRFTTRLTVRNATAIVTPSQSTKNDLVRIFNAAADRITPIWLGFDSDRFSQKIKPTKEITALQPYFVMLGRLELRKNTAGAIQAFGKLRAEDPELTPRLVLIGKPGYGYDKVENALAALPEAVRNDVIIPGYLNDQEVVQYMASAAAFLYPSLYEGFGIPILEAMATGTPVITSDISANPEVADDAAVFVDPNDTDELARLMAIFATDELSRTEMIKKGSDRVKEFSWEKMAKETLTLLEQVAKEGK